AATSVLTECTAASRTANESPDVIDANAGLRRSHGALASPRYILEATCNEALRRNVRHLAQVLQDYRDSHGEVMGADELSEGARVAIEAKIGRERQKMLDKHQLRLQADMQSQLFGKLLENMTPEQLRQALPLAGRGSAPSNKLPIRAGATSPDG